MRKKIARRKLSTKKRHSNLRWSLVAGAAVITLTATFSFTQSTGSVKGVSTIQSQTMQKGSSPFSNFFSFFSQLFIHRNANTNYSNTISPTTTQTDAQTWSGDLAALPLGDNQYSNAPKVGYVYSCQAMRGNTSGTNKGQTSSGNQTGGQMMPPNSQQGVGQQMMGQNGQRFGDFGNQMMGQRPGQGQGQGSKSGNTNQPGQMMPGQNNQAAGAYKQGPWINTTTKTWDATQKFTVDGNVSWPNATWSVSSDGTTRTLKGNGLPIYHTTGVYPIASTDDAYQYDRNPNSISSQKISLQLPTNPTLLNAPQCIGGEVGVMLSGVPLFSAFDEGMRDANAWEIQDSCEGHPQKDGEYHYHGYSACLKDNTSADAHSDLVGYAFDGFGIFGLKGEDGKELKTSDLDECHGHTHEIIWDGKKVTMYHYHLTRDFPYSVSCFRGKLVVNQAANSINGIQNSQGGMYRSQQGGMMQGSPNSNGGPPQAAISACSGKTSGSTCEVTTPNGSISGTCQTPPNSTTIACIPSKGRPSGQNAY